MVSLALTMSGFAARLRKRWLAIPLLMLGLTAALPIDVWAQTGAPAPGAQCIAMAQNRSVPLSASGDYELSNLPGSGFIPFGLNGEGQPFRVRATCDDGSVGETAMAFPRFDERLVQAGPIVWGQNTLVASRLGLSLPLATIGLGESLQAQTTAYYPNGQVKNVTPRLDGTGYRSSANGFVGVEADGRVFVQSQGLINTVASVVPLPSLVTVTAENDGVVATRVIKLVGASSLSGQVEQANGQPAAGAQVLLRMNGYADRLAQADGAGRYRFVDLPFAMNRMVFLTAFVAQSRGQGSTSTYLPNSGPAQAATIRLQDGGFVRVTVLDRQGQPLPGIEVNLNDSLRNLAEGQGLPPVKTDASGVAHFEPVAAGLVTPILAQANYEASPSSGYVATGGFQPFVLRLAAPAAAGSDTSVTGRLVQAPNQQPVAGPSVEIWPAYESGLQRKRMQVAGDGRFLFNGLRPSTDYAIEVKQGLELVLTGSVLTGAAGTQVERDLSLSAPRGLALQLLEANGQPAAGATVQLSVFNDSLQTWGQVASAQTPSDGRLQWRRLLASRYRLDALAADSSSASLEVDLTQAPIGSVRNVQLQLSERLAQTRLGLRATVMGASNFANLNAQLWVQNSRCATACDLGLLRSSADRLETELLPQGSNEFELRWQGRVLRFNLNVDAATDGQTVERVLDFPPDALGQIKFVQQRSLFSFDAVAGEPIDAILMGLAAPSQPSNIAPARALKLQLYGPDGLLVAEGFGADPAA